MVLRAMGKRLKDFYDLKVSFNENFLFIDGIKHLHTLKKQWKGIISFFFLILFFSQADKPKF